MLEIGCTVPGAPLEVTRAEGLGGRACWDDLRLVQVDCDPYAAEAFNESGEEAADGWGGTSAEAVVEEKGADIDASQIGGLRGGTGLSDGRVDSQGEEDRTEGVSLLYSPSAGNDLQGHTTGTGEQGALAAITAVDPRREGRKVGAHGPQDGGPVNRVESVGHVHRDGDLARV